MLVDRFQDLSKDWSDLPILMASRASCDFVQGFFRSQTRERMPFLLLGAPGAGLCSSRCSTYLLQVVFVL